MKNRKLFLDHHDIERIKWLFAGDYLPRDVAPAIGFDVATVVKIRGVNTIYYHDTIEVTAEQYRAFKWFKDNVHSMSNWHAMGKPNPIEMSEPKKQAQTKTIVCTCLHCGATYQAQRKSSKFCSAKCRVAFNRALKVAARKNPDLFEAINELGHLVESKDYGHAATITLINLKKAIDFFMPGLTRWWKCDICSKQIMVFCPGDNSCDCGHSAKWYVVNKI